MSVFPKCTRRVCGPAIICVHCLTNSFLIFFVPMLDCSSSSSNCLIGGLVLGFGTLYMMIMSNFWSMNLFVCILIVCLLWFNMAMTCGWARSYGSSSSSGSGVEPNDEGLCKFIASKIT